MRAITACRVEYGRRTRFPDGVSMEQQKSEWGHHDKKRRVGR